MQVHSASEAIHASQPGHSIGQRRGFGVVTVVTRRFDLSHLDLEDFGDQDAATR